ncbi:hypothetical protein E0H54_01725 [Rhizobium leguminosarum bv. viciae]|nr:hypothetical protein E0H54_01725 [Rhizobium leguminosarum bv. viciae]
MLLPLTLTLSPLAGRGDAPDEALVRDGEVAACPLIPITTGRRWRQPDEGLATDATASQPLVGLHRRAECGIQGFLRLFGAREHVTHHDLDLV